MSRVGWGLGAGRGRLGAGPRDTPGYPRIPPTDTLNPSDTVGAGRRLKFQYLLVSSVNSVESAKGSQVATARLDGETMARLDDDAETLDECRADQIRRAVATWHRLRDGRFRCPCCDEPIEVSL